MRSIVFVLVLLVGCSSKKPTEPGPSQPPPPPVMTEEECKAKNGRVNASIGGGSQAHCNDDENDLGPVKLGIEGGWCCVKK